MRLSGFSCEILIDSPANYSIAANTTKFFALLLNQSELLFSQPDVDLNQRVILNWRAAGTAALRVAHASYILGLNCYCKRVRVVILLAP